MNFCRHCGAKVATPTDRFCANCGSPLAEEAAGAAQAAVPESAPAAALPTEPSAVPPESPAGGGFTAPGNVAFFPADAPGGQVGGGSVQHPLLSSDLPPRPNPAPAPTANPSPWPSMDSGPGSDSHSAAPAQPQGKRPPSQAPSAPGARHSSAAWQPVSPAEPAASQPQPEPPAQAMPRQSIQPSVADTPSDWSDLQDLFQPAPAAPPAAKPAVFDYDAEDEALLEETSLLQPPAAKPASSEDLFTEPATVAEQPTDTAMTQAAPQEQPAAEPRQRRQEPQKEAAPRQQAPRQRQPEQRQPQATQELPSPSVEEEKAKKIKNIQQAAIEAEAPAQVFPGGQPVGGSSAVPGNDLFNDKAQQPQQVYRPAPAVPTPARDNLPKPRLPEETPRRSHAYESEPPRRSRRSGGGLASRMLTVILVIVLVAVVGFALVLGMLYYTNRPAAAINDFTEALSANDYAKLKRTVSLEGIEANDESWAALCEAFSDADALVRLKAQLNTGGDAVAGTPYPAITLESSDFLLFVKKHTVKLHGVSMLAPGAGAGTTLKLGTTNYEGQETDGSMLYIGIMPGRYDYQLVTSAGAVPATPVTVETFDQSTPLVLDGSNAPAADPAAPDGGEPAAVGTLTISNCISDDAVLLVGGAEVPEKPVGGVVTLPNVPVGSEVRIRGEKDGKTLESAMIFSDAAVTELAFGEYTEVTPEENSEPPALGEADINAALTAFYTSYLECINAQSTDPLQISTDSARSAVAARIANPANAENTFTFVSAACDFASAKAVTVGDAPGIEVNATFQYSYKPRDDAAAAAQTGSNRQTIQLVQQGGSWYVNSFAMIN